jgi:hypothetical protein
VSLDNCVLNLRGIFDRRWKPLVLLLLLLGANASETGKRPWTKAIAQPAKPIGRTFYVAVAGVSRNDGSAEHPLDLATALSSRSPARPGDTVWLRGGRYRGTFTSALRGAPGAPIVVRAYPGERVVIDSSPSGRVALYVGGSWTWYWGLEITNSDPRRVTKDPGPWPSDSHRGTGVSSRAPSVKFINMVVHDLGSGFGIWAEAVGAELYGNIIYNNGWQGPDRAHGHGIYTQSRSGGRRIGDNVIFNQYSHGIHAYGTAIAYLDDIQLEGNAVFNNGAPSRGREYDRNVLLGGERTAENPVLRSNYTYYGSAKSGNENNIGYHAGCTNLIAEDNYFAGGSPMELVHCTILSLARNHVYGRISERLSPHSSENVFAASPPDVNAVFVRPNAFEQGRAHVVIFNWEHRPNIAIDLGRSGLRVGERFEVRDVERLFGPAVTTGVYQNGAVELSLVQEDRDLPVVGGHRPIVREFAVFVVLGEPKGWPEEHTSTTVGPGTDKDRRSPALSRRP